MNQFQPVFFRLSCEEEKTQYQLLLEQHPEIEIIDCYEKQLDELIKIQNPKRKFSFEELAAERQRRFGEEYAKQGVWVYYSWSRRLIHLLDEKDFVRVRTNRNLYKIKPAEHHRMSQKRIGLVGLSVGHAVALTLAQERCFGELRIADFDCLDLSNLNRIRTGVQNIGLPKTTIVAREIAEIDPFLKVSVFEEGITEDNMEAFLSEGGNLDLLIDECDSLDIKIKCREEARKRGIPVIMETSDRGMLDIERFDLDPQRPIMHGLVKDLDSSKLKGLTNEEKVPYIFPMIEMDESSLRLRASMFEIEQSISTWPQLASDVTLGGATVCNVARRILLDHIKDSGRFFIDLNALIKDQKEPEDIVEDRSLEALDLNEVIDCIKAIHLPNHMFNTPLESDEIDELIEAANLAPSGGNNQPWTWITHEQKIYLVLNKEANRSLLDHSFSGSMIAFGAASKNLKIKAFNMGYQIFQELLDFETDGFIVHSSFAFKEAKDSLSLQNKHLVKQISKRHTSRINQSTWDIPFAFIESLRAIEKREPFAKIRLVTGAGPINEIGKIIRNCDKLRVMHQKAHSELMDEIRWNEKENNIRKDGIDIDTLYLSPAEHAGLKISQNWDVISFLKEMKKGSGFLKLSEKSIASASALGLISIPTESAFQFFNAGKFLQEVWLSATEFSIGFQPLTASLFMMKRARAEEQFEFSLEEQHVLLKEYEKIRIGFGLPEGEFPAFLFRLCLTHENIKKSLRKPIKHSLIRT